MGNELVKDNTINRAFDKTGASVFNDTVNSSVGELTRRVAPTQNAGDVLRRSHSAAMFRGSNVAKDMFRMIPRVASDLARNMNAPRGVQDILAQAQTVGDGVGDIMDAQGRRDNMGIAQSTINTVGNTANLLGNLGKRAVSDRDEMRQKRRRM